MPLVSQPAITLDRWGIWTQAPIEIEAGWSETCNTIVACPWDGDEAPEYGDCHSANVDATVTTSGVAATVTSTGAVYDGVTGAGLYQTYTVQAQAGSLSIHVAMTNADTGETQSKDATLAMRDLEDFRFRCIVGPNFYGANPQPCPDPLPAGSEIEVLIDGRGGDRYDFAPVAVTFSGIELRQNQSCVEDIYVTDDHYVESCYIASVPQSVTVTASAFGVTRSDTIAVQ